MPPETWPGAETTGLAVVESSTPCLPAWLSTFMDGQKENTALCFLAVSTMPSGPKETHIPSRDEWCKTVRVNMLALPLLMSNTQSKPHLIKKALLYNNAKNKPAVSGDQAYTDFILFCLLVL